MPYGEGYAVIAQYLLVSMSLALTNVCSRQKLVRISSRNKIVYGNCMLTKMPTLSALRFT